MKQIAWLPRAPNQKPEERVFLLEPFDANAFYAIILPALGVLEGAVIANLALWRFWHWKDWLLQRL
ncbi:MAG: hypothetical protein NT067_07580 [Candidatus Diapherotrites archaeon]|nr:hypothetical protein [Candidatus Diapherotrites archaeon]